MVPIGCGCNKKVTGYRVDFKDGSDSKTFTDHVEAQRAASGGKGVVRPIKS